jgi:hypothetical protein
VNRLKKEEQRRHREAREGLSPKENAALDRREAEVRKHEEEVREWHLRLFTEEYDFMADSSAEAKLRARGINPMSPEYVQKTNEQRHCLGFAPYMVVDSDMPSDTYGWVARMVEQGEQRRLAELYHRWFG